MIYSYKLTCDNGSAPCVDKGLLSLTICKPMIRKNCKIGDYILGIGSKSMQLGNKHKIIFIAKITQKITMMKYYKEYKYRKDCIYDDKCNQLKNIYHCSKSIDKDLIGINSLLSEDFIYFGDRYIDLPLKFYDMVKKYQGHKSISNNKFLNSFPLYFNSLKQLYGMGKIGRFNTHHNYKCT